MRFFSKFTMMICLAGLFSISCERAPNFPDAPSIEFKKVEFEETAFLDSLIITITIKDGDGDLGLDGTGADIEPPFQTELYYSATTGSPYINNDPSNPVVPNENFDNVIIYGYFDEGEVIKTTTLDSLPDYNPALIFCDTYEELLDSDSVRQILYSRPNPNNKNLFLKYFVKKSGVFEGYELPCDFLNPNVRFPRLIEDNVEGPVEMELRYAITELSGYYTSLFRNDTLQLKMAVRDRAGNISNSTLSNPFTLNDF